VSGTLMDGGIVKVCAAYGDIVRIRINRFRGSKFRICVGKSVEIVKVDGSGGMLMFRGSIFRPIRQAIMKGVTKSPLVGWHSKTFGSLTELGYRWKSRSSNSGSCHW
jgi:hypothetical protein